MAGLAEGAAPAPLSPLSAGETVRAFYHMNDHPNGYRYLRLLDAAPEEAPEGQSKESMVVGLSTGWMPAKVEEDWKPGQGGDDRVLVKLYGNFADPYRKEELQPVVGMYWKVKRQLVRPMSSPHAPPAELSLLVVRWWDYWKNKRSRSHNVANEEMLLDMLEGPGSPHESFGKTGMYQVHSAFIRNTSDLASVGGQLAASMRGKRRAGMYFLWPTQRPAVELRMAGSVEEKALLDLMERMEAEGVVSCFPHPVKMYRELAGKSWAAKVCSRRPELCVPPTVVVEKAAFEAEPQAQAEAAIAQLRALRAEADGEEAPAERPYRGVAKLSYSWMGEDVRPFTGPDELTKVLRLHFDGASPNAACLVQERVESVVCEIRIVCFRDLAAGPDAVKREVARMRLHPPRNPSDQTFALTSHNTMTRGEAAESAFGGDAGALQAAEQEAHRLTDLWLAWLREEGHATPPHMRFDYLVAKPPGGARGQASGQQAATFQVRTVELCENGGALCGCAAAPRATACLNDCVAVDPPNGFPLALPTLLEPIRPPAASEGAGAGGAHGRQRQHAGRGAAPGGGSPTLALLERCGLGGRKWMLLLAAIAVLFLRLRKRLH